MDYRERNRRLRTELERRRLDALLVTHLPNVRYLCGFTGSSGVLIAGTAKSVFITDGRYTEQSAKEVQDARIVIGKRAALAEAAKQIARMRLASVGIEAEQMTVAARSTLKKLVPRTRLRDTINLVAGLRMVKDASEADAIREAVLLGASLFDQILPQIRPGMAESTIAGEMELAARRAGAEGMSFPTIVAGGTRSALPHGRASAEPLPQRGFVVLDWGAILRGYCSDETRTVHLGKPDAQARAMYNAVRDAQSAAIDAVRAGRRVGDVDRAARKPLEKAGFGQYFTHSTGHGVGLEIHEAPRIARNQQEPLEAGMVVTVEPGIYIPGVGGVRIEDMVRVTADGCDVLTPTTKELIVV